MEKKISINKLVMAAVCLALCMVLPFLTGQIPEIGSKLSPMHIPVFLCGFLCGWPYAMLVGLIAPALRFLLFGMPPIFPTGASMMAELMVYGLCTGIFSRMLPEKPSSLYLSLAISMLLGRIAWGMMRWLFMAFGSTFTFQAFLAGAFLDAWPGIICHLMIIPPIVLALKKAGLMKK